MELTVLYIVAVSTGGYRLKGRVREAVGAARPCQRRGGATVGRARVARVRLVDGDL